MAGAGIRQRGDAADAFATPRPLDLEPKRSASSARV
jgi:hypothetical protein